MTMAQLIDAIRAPEGDQGGSGGDGGDGGQGQGQGAGSGGGQQQGGGNSPAMVSMTQADMDRLVADRVARAERGAVANLLKDLGVESADDLKAMAKAQAAADEAAKTDLQKAQEAQQAAERLAASAAAGLEQQLVANAFLAEGLKAGIPAERLGDALALADTSTVEVADGVVSGMAEAVKALVEAKPWVVGTMPNGKPAGSGADGGARGTGDKPPALDQGAIDMAQRMGVSADSMDSVARAAHAKPNTPEHLTYVQSVAARLFPKQNTPAE
jgi:hypothetical protein